MAKNFGGRLTAPSANRVYEAPGTKAIDSVSIGVGGSGGVSVSVCGPGATATYGGLAPYGRGGATGTPSMASPTTGAVTIALTTRSCVGGWLAGAAAAGAGPTLIGRAS